MSSEREWMKDHLTGVTPLPFGERVAPPRRWSWGGRWFRVRPGPARRALVGAGWLMAVCGGALLAWPGPSISVSMSAHAYQLGAQRLVEASPGWYRGDGVMVVARQADGSIDTASSFEENGQAGRGACRVDERTGTERCRFWIGGRAVLSAFDIHRAGGWDRHYADGGVVWISDGSMDPVPFPVGR